MIEAPAYEGCQVPQDLLYDVVNDVWVRREGDEAVVGMTDAAQTRCGKLVAISFRPVGKTIPRGRGLAAIESAKWVGPVPSPLTGVVLVNNEDAFRRDLLVANKDPYGDGWMVRLRVSDPAGFDDLMPGPAALEAYRIKIDELGLRCIRCADGPMPMMGDF